MHDSYTGNMCMNNLITLEDPCLYIKWLPSQLLTYNWQLLLPIGIPAIPTAISLGLQHTDYGTTNQ